MLKIRPPLRINIVGRDVPLVHKALEAAGFEVPRKDMTEQRFGAGTRKAVAAFQKHFALEPSGEIGEREARLLGRFLVDERPRSARCNSGSGTRA